MHTACGVYIVYPFQERDGHGVITPARHLRCISLHTVTRRTQQAPYRHWLTNILDLPTDRTLAAIRTMYLLHLLSLAVWAAVTVDVQACVVDDDCSLNGRCVSGNKTNTSSDCQCDLGWSGSDCGRLDLAPATRYTGFNNTNFTSQDHYNNRGNSSWGGQIVQDQDDPKLFHLLYDQFAHGCGLSGWRPTSFIARAESTSGPQGPYLWKQNVTSSFRHNAYVYWSPADDKYLLWSIGVDVPDPKQCGGINKYVDLFAESYL